MRHLVLGLALLFGLLLGSLALLPELVQADPCAASGPATAITTTAPVTTTYGGYSSHPVKVVVADAVYPVFDYHVKDVFVFTGPPPVIPAGAGVAVTGAGSEVRTTTGAAGGTGLPGPAVTTGSAAGAGVDGRREVIRALLAEDESSDLARPVVGADAGYSVIRPASSPGPATPSGAAGSLDFLRGSCASCHSAPRAKGGLTLFGADGALQAGIDWRAVSDAVSPGEKGRPQMPPASSGIAPLSAEQVQLVRAMVR